MKTNAKIYLMRSEDGSLKLGHSRNPAVRSKQVGRPVEIVHETDVLEHAERIERLAHRVLALHGKHIRGEWFEATIDQAVEAIEIAVRQAESHELELGGRLVSTAGRPLAYGERLVRVNVMLSSDIVEAAAHEAARSGRTLSEVYRDWIDIGRADRKQKAKR